MAQSQHELALQRATRLARHAELAKDRAEVRERHGVVGLQFGRALITCGRARRVALREVSRSQVVVNRRQIGLEPQGAAIGCDRLVERAAVLVHVAQSAVEKRHLGVGLDRLLQPAFGSREIAVAVVRGAEQEHGLGIARFAGQGFFGAAQGVARAARRQELAPLQDQIKRCQRAGARRRKQSQGGRRLHLPWCRRELPRPPRKTRLPRNGKAFPNRAAVAPCSGRSRHSAAA